MAQGSSQRLSYTTCESVMRFLQNIPFNFYKLGHFSPILSFSHAEFEILELKKFTTASTLFGVSSVQEFQAKLSGVLGQDLFALFEAEGDIDFSFAKYKYNEKDTFKLITQAVLQRLGTVILDRHQFSQPNKDTAYSKKAIKPFNEDFDMDWLGMGNPTTWHGYPDGRFRVKSNDISLLSHDNSDRTPGNSTLIEAKCNLLDDQKLMQLITTTVVASFVEKNLHRDLMDVIPTLMIGPTSAIICIYDVTQDYLLICEKFEWLETDEDGDDDDKYVFNKPGFVLLWMALNHRDFLCKIQSEVENLRSTIKQKLQFYDKYEEFENLSRKNLRFPKKRGTTSDGGYSEEVPITVLVQPQLKRTKTL